MIYLLTKIGLYLLGAAVIGGWLGWWLRHAKAQNATEALLEKQRLANSMIEDLQSFVEERDKHINSQTMELDHERTQSIELTQTNSKHVARLATLDEEVIDLRTTRVALSTDLAEAQNQLQDAAEEQQQSAENLSRTQAELAEKESTVATMAEIRDSIQQTLDTTQAKLHNNTRDLARALQAEQNARQQIDTMVPELASLKSEQAAQASELSQAQRELEIQIKRVQQSTTDSETAKTNLNKADQELGQLRSGRTVLVSQLAEAKDSLERLSSDIRTWRGKIPELQNEIEERDVLIADLQARQHYLVAELSRMLPKQAAIAERTALRDLLIRTQEAHIAESLDNRANVQLAKNLEASLSARATNARNPPDDLKRIKGIGPKLETQLHEQGICRFEQIANLSVQDIADLDERLQFKGRIQRDDWVNQAKAFALYNSPPYP